MPKPNTRPPWSHHPLNLYNIRLRCITAMAQGTVPLDPSSLYDAKHVYEHLVLR